MDFEFWHVVRVSSFYETNNFLFETITTLRVRVFIHILKK